MITNGPESFRHYLREWRVHRGMTQVELAEAIGTFKGVISRYETGERGISFEMQYKLMKALNITPGQFFASPDVVSLDALAQSADPETRRRLERVVAAMVKPDDPK